MLERFLASSISLLSGPKVGYLKNKKTKTQPNVGKRKLNSKALVWNMLDIISGAASKLHNREKVQVLIKTRPRERQGKCFKTLSLQPEVCLWSCCSKGGGWRLKHTSEAPWLAAYTRLERRELGYSHCHLLECTWCWLWSHTLPARCSDPASSHGFAPRK